MLALTAQVAPGSSPSSGGDLLGMEASERKPGGVAVVRLSLNGASRGFHGPSGESFPEKPGMVDKDFVRIPGLLVQGFLT